MCDGASPSQLTSRLTTVYEFEISYKIVCVYGLKIDRESNFLNLTKKFNKEFLS